MSLPKPPLARRAPERRERFGIVWTDEYAWLRDPAYPDVKEPEIRAYVEAENAYYEAFMAPHRGLVERLHAELKGRIKEDDQLGPGARGRVRVPVALHPRHPVPRLDAPRAGRGGAGRHPRRERAGARQGLFPAGRLRADLRRPPPRLRLRRGRLGALPHPRPRPGERRGEHRPRHQHLGRRRVGRGRPLAPLRRAERPPAPVPRPAARLGSDPADDPVLYEEADPAFFVSVAKTLQPPLRQIATGTHVTREVRLVDAAEPTSPPRLVAKRREGHRYSVSHAHGRLFDPDQRPARELPPGHARRRTSRTSGTGRR